MKGFIVEYSTDSNEVCLFPNSYISSCDFLEMVKCFNDHGYKWCVSIDKRYGYRFSKTLPENIKTNEG